MFEELPLTLLEYSALAGAAVLAIWVWASRDTHGWVAVGYRTPFRQLSRSAQAKVWLSLAASVLAGALVLRRVLLLG